MLGKANTQHDYPPHLFNDIEYVNKYFASVCSDPKYSVSDCPWQLIPLAIIQLQMTFMTTDANFENCCVLAYAALI